MTKAENEKLNAHEALDRNQRGKIELRGMDPRKSFFMGLSVGNLDGSICDLNNGGGEGVELICDTETEAFSQASEFNDSYPTLEVWVYKCVPIAKCWRGKTRITKFK